MSVLVIDPEIHRDLADKGFRYVIPTLDALASVASADGHATVGLGNLCDRTQLSRSSVERHVRILEQLGIVLRIDGGYRGRCVTYVVKRFLTDASAFAAKSVRAMRKVYASRRERWEQIRRRRQEQRTGHAQGLKKVLTDAHLLTSLEGEQASAGAAGPAPHTFVQGELLGICGQCEFPEANARHRNSSTRKSQAAPRSTWTNKRFA